MCTVSTSHVDAKSTYCLEGLDILRAMVELVHFQLLGPQCADYSCTDESKTEYSWLNINQIYSFASNDRTHIVF